MSEQLETTVTLLPASRELESGPALVVTSAQPSEGTAELFAASRELPFACTAGAPAVAIALAGLLNTPDRVHATGFRHDRRSFELRLEIRWYDGSLAANVRQHALVRMELGSLDAGSHRLTVEKTRLRFSNINAPETATDPHVSTQTYTFECV